MADESAGSRETINTPSLAEIFSQVQDEFKQEQEAREVGTATAAA